MLMFVSASYISVTLKLKPPKMQKIYQILLVVTCSISFTMAQQIQSPSDFLGYELGTLIYKTITVL